LADTPKDNRGAPRVVIDTLAPFLAAGDTSGAALAHLVEWLDSCGVTSVITMNGDVTDSIDRRLEPVIERAAVIARMVHVGGTSFRAEIVRARHAIASGRPIAFDIVAGVGVTTPQLEAPVIPDDAPPPRVLLA